MDDSILLSIKKLLGIQSDYDYFDPDIMMCINSTFATLTQLGVGPEGGFSISDENVTWKDFVGTDPKMEMVKTYTYLRVKLLFDPPNSGVLHEAVERQIQELEWRLTVACETYEVLKDPNVPEEEEITPPVIEPGDEEVESEQTP